MYSHKNQNIGQNLVNKILSNKSKIESVWFGRLLESPMFVIQEASTTKNGVEFCQKYISVIRCNLATSYNDVRRRATLSKVFCHRQTD